MCICKYATKYLKYRSPAITQISRYKTFVLSFPITQTCKSALCSYATQHSDSLKVPRRRRIQCGHGAVNKFARIIRYESLRREIHVNLTDIYQFLSPTERFLISFLYSGPFSRSLNHAGSLVSLQRPLLHYSLPAPGRLFRAILSRRGCLWKTSLVFPHGSRPG